MLERLMHRSEAAGRAEDGDERRNAEHQTDLAGHRHDGRAGRRSCRGRSAVSAERIVGKATPPPPPPTSQPGRKSATYDGCAPTRRSMRSVPAPNSVDPM